MRWPALLLSALLLPPCPAIRFCAPLPLRFSAEWRPTLSQVPEPAASQVRLTTDAKIPRARVSNTKGAEATTRFDHGCRCESSVPDVRLRFASSACPSEIRRRNAEMRSPIPKPPHLSDLPLGVNVGPRAAPRPNDRDDSKRHRGVFNAGQTEPCTGPWAGRAEASGHSDNRRATARGPASARARAHGRAPPPH